ncbi:MAG: acetylxylan esterase, partial [Armatimonadetes bacterium]|nr:acetylxylan esterase [Armatimonadota bacterium]
GHDRLAGGEASAANLVTLDVTTTDSDYITSADTRLPFLIRVRSGGDQPFAGKLTATLHDYETRQEVDRTELPLTAPAGGSAGAVLPLGREQAGWYDAKLQLTGQCGGQAINLTKEFTIGVDPAKAVPPLYRPADLKEFWAKTLQELAARPMNARLTPMESLSTDRAAVYKLQLQGLVDEPFFAWYVHPKKPGKHPATLLVPGYGDHGIGNPRGLAEAGICAVSIQVRHTDVDLPKYEGKPYMTLGIDSPETYVYRDIYCMGVRAIDFLLSRPEVDPEKVMVQGMSQGGGLSIATAALDPRVKLAAAEVPFLCDYPEALKVASYPYGEIRNYLNEHPERREQVLRTLSYFDGMNLAPEIRCPVVMTVGLRDRVCPPPTVWAAYHYITAPKQIFVYPAMGHAVSSEFGQAREQWARTLMPLP